MKVFDLPTLIYLTSISIPNSFASRYQIMKMSESFAKITDYELWVSAQSQSLNKINQYYQIKQKLKINIVHRRVKAFFYLRLYQWIKKNKAAIFYSREFNLLIFLKIFFPNSKTFLELHELPTHLGIRGKINFFLLKSMKGIVVISDKLKQDLMLTFGLTADQLWVEHDAVDPELFRSKPSKIQLSKIMQKMDKRSSEKIILYLGSFHERKGVFHLLQSMKFFEPLKIKCVLVGGAREEVSALKQYCDENKILSAVILERVETLEISAWLKSADVLVLPNRSDDAWANYTSPLKLFQYMSSGKPIVASKLPSIIEVLNSSNAVLTQPNNPKNLAQGIKKLLKNSKWAQKLAKQALQDVKNYTWDARAESILGYIAERIKQ